MSEEQKIRPKGSMCANCTHKDETCNLDFASMPKISRDADGWDVVRCTRFERAEKVKDVHTEHCCSRHGCKYGKDDECTVMLGIAPPSYPCEFCDDPEEKRIAELETLAAELAYLVRCWSGKYACKLSELPERTNKALQQFDEIGKK